MNLNDKRLGAYNKILKETRSAEPEENAAPRPRSRPDAKPDPKPAGKPTAKTSLNPKPSTVQPMKASRHDRPRQDAPPDGTYTSYEIPGLIKVPSTGTGAKESPYRKVAKFLLLIGVEEAAKVMSKLTEAQTEKVVLELASIRRVDKDEAAIVLAEFESLLVQAREPSGGVGTARNILETAFGKERAQEMLNKAVPNLKGKPFDYLEGMEPDRILRIIIDELPVVKALVLSQLKPRQAADVIRLMESGDKNETVLRLAKMKTINPDILRRVDDTVREKVQSVQTPSSDSIDGRSALASILKHMDGTSEKAILGGLSDSDPDLGKDIRDRLFTIDDIINADDKFLQAALRPLTERDIAILLAGKSESFRDKILSNVSRTRGTIIQEEEKIIVPVSRAESEKITGSFFSTMRRAWENGEFYISGRDTKEVWV